MGTMSLAGVTPFMMAEIPEPRLMPPWVPMAAPVIRLFFGKMACRYVSFELPEGYLELAQALLVGYFEKLERG
jgi:hypothetical protein